MKLKFFDCIIGMAVVVSSPLVVAKSEPQLLDLAMNMMHTNQRLKMAEARISQEKAAKSEAYSSYVPEVQLQSRSSRTQGPTGAGENTSLLLTRLNQKVLSGEGWLAIGQSDISLKIAENQYTLEQQKLLFQLIF